MTRHEPPPIEVAFTCLMLELARLERTDLDLAELRHPIRRLDLHAGLLCELLDDGSTREELDDCVDDTATVAVELASKLERIDEPAERRDRDLIALSREALVSFLEMLAPFDRRLVARRGRDSVDTARRRLVEAL